MKKKSLSLVFFTYEKKSKKKKGRGQLSLKIGELNERESTVKERVTLPEGRGRQSKLRGLR